MEWVRGGACGGVWGGNRPRMRGRVSRGLCSMMELERILSGFERRQRGSGWGHVGVVGAEVGGADLLVGVAA